MPSTTSSSVSSDLASSTVMTPSLPTRCMAPAIILPIDASPLADTVPTWATSEDELTCGPRRSMSLTTAPTAMSMPRLRSIGFMPAATDLAPSLTMAWASTVAVVVPSPARSEVFCDTSRTIWAPMFSNLSSSSISLATVTPSLVIRGAPNDLSRTTLRPLGPSVTRTALARISTPRSMRSRASVENFTSLAAMEFYSGAFILGWVGTRRCGSARLFAGGQAAAPGSGDHAHDVGFFHDQQLLAVELDFGARPLAEQHLIAGLDVGLDQLPGLVAAARAHGDDLALLRLLLARIGAEDAAGRLRFGLDAADDDAVVQGTELELGHVFLIGAKRAGLDRERRSEGSLALAHRARQRPGNMARAGRCQVGSEGSIGRGLPGCAPNSSSIPACAGIRRAVACAPGEGLEAFQAWTSAPLRFAPFQSSWLARLGIGSCFDAGTGPQSRCTTLH